MTRMARRLAVVLLALGCVTALSACDDFSLVAVTTTPNLAALPSLPPIGFNHRYGNNPVASADGFQLERLLFSHRAEKSVTGRLMAAVGIRPSRSQR